MNRNHKQGRGVKLAGVAATAVGIAIAVSGLAHAGSVDRLWGRTGIGGGTTATSAVDGVARARLTNRVADGVVDSLKDDDTGKLNVIPKLNLGGSGREREGSRGGSLGNIIGGSGILHRAARSTDRVVEYFIRP